MTTRSTGSMDLSPEEIVAFEVLMDSSTVGPLDSAGEHAVPDSVQAHLNAFAAHIAGRSGERSVRSWGGSPCGVVESANTDDEVFLTERDRLPGALSSRGFGRATSEAGSLMLEGDLDVRTAADVRHRLHAAVDEGYGDLVLDLTRLRAWDATGLGVIMGTHRRALRVGRRLVLRGVPTQLQRLLVATKLHRILAIERFLGEGAFEMSRSDKFLAELMDVLT